MKILLIEAREVVARLLVDTFRKQGHICDHTSLGEDGVDIVTTKFYTYDIIVIGSRLLDVVSIDVLKLIRAAKVSTPIIITVETLKETIEALNLGADDCMVEPVNVYELMARMRAVTRRPREYREPMIDLGRLIVDQQEERVEVDGREIHLTKTEFALLEVLALHPEKLVRSKTLELHTTGDEALRVHLSKLRKKLGDGFISTVWGRGLILNKLEKLVGH